jgi:hypothetical protein
MVPVCFGLVWISYQLQSNVWTSHSAMLGSLVLQYLLCCIIYSPACWFTFLASIQIFSKTKTKELGWWNWTRNLQCCILILNFNFWVIWSPEFVRYFVLMHRQQKWNVVQHSLFSVDPGTIIYSKVEMWNGALDNGANMDMIFYFRSSWSLPAAWRCYHACHN